MADEDNANDLGDGLEGDAPAGKKGGVKGAFPQLLKMSLIGVAAIIFIVTIVVVTPIILIYPILLLKKQSYLYTKYQEMDFIRLSK